MKNQTIDMTIEEAAELYNRGLVRQRRERTGESYFCEQSNLLNPLGMMPFSLSEISCSILSEEMPPIKGKDRYTSGRVYLARKNKDKLEFVSVKVIRPKDWKGDAPEGHFIYGWTCGSKDENRWEDGPVIYQLFGKDNLDLKKVAEYNPSYERRERRSVFEIEEKATLDDISRLPVWDNLEDYEKFMREVYGNENIDRRLRKGEKFYVVYPGKIDSQWQLLLGCLSSIRWCDTYQYIFCEPRPDLTLRIGVHPNKKKRDTTVERYLLEEYVQPQNLGNGVIVMNEDRIPKYLKRILGF